MDQMETSNDLIKPIGPHSIKKFELVEEYVKAWAHKILEYGRNSGKCCGLVFIDCMCNSGLYYDDKHNTVIGTPIRVAKVLSEIMKEANYQQQHAWIYLNDLSPEKIKILSAHLPPNTRNFHVETSHRDGNELLVDIGNRLTDDLNIHYLLLYDPFEAAIDWDAITPFLNHWGEVIINHMVSDTIRAASVVKRPESMAKYEGTYQLVMDAIRAIGTNKVAFENRIEQIITERTKDRNHRYYVAAFPFFNRCNALVYNLIHCTRHIEGYKLFKTTAWKTFEGKSSMKNTHGIENQLSFDFLDVGKPNDFTTITDEYCYFTKDIAKYIQEHFRGNQNIPAKEVWDYVDLHPVFPTDGFKTQIENDLKFYYGVTVSKRPTKAFSFTDRRG